MDDLDSYLPPNLHTTLLEDATSYQLDELDLHRQLRSYYRKIVYELPQLADYRVPFTPPADGDVLQFRKTTYLDGTATTTGDASGPQTTGRGGHPSASKVVMQVAVSRLGLSAAEKLKFVKLAGVRYDVRKDQLKMSSEVFHSPSLNQRRLSDTLDRLLAEAKKLGPDDETLEDLPVDKRHLKGKKRPSFPKEWRMPQQQQQQQQQQS